MQTESHSILVSFLLGFLLEVESFAPQIFPGLTDLQLKLLSSVLTVIEGGDPNHDIYQL